MVGASLQSSERNNGGRELGSNTSPQGCKLLHDSYFIVLHLVLHWICGMARTCTLPQPVNLHGINVVSQLLVVLRHLTI